MPGLLEGKIALVTGAGHGIGRGHAVELAKHGATVIVNDLGSSTSAVRAAGATPMWSSASSTSRGGTAAANYGDVGDEAQATAMVQQAIDTYGKLDIVVNNAGIVRDRAIWNMSADDFDLVMRVHVRGTWLTCRAAAQHWRERSKAGERNVGGRIINTTSGAGPARQLRPDQLRHRQGGDRRSHPDAQPRAVQARRHRNVIGPGGITRISGTMRPEAVREPDEIPDDEFDRFDPSLCSPVVAWLCSDEAGYVSGQVIRAMGEHIHLMGGWTEEVTLSNGGTRWDAEKLGDLFAVDVFKTRAPGLRMSG